MFYEKLKRLCFERGISVSKMAVELKLSTTTVTGWKRGAMPQPAQVKKIAAFFEISTDELMRETPPTASPAEPQSDNKSADLMGLVISQQDAIRNLSESSKSLAKSNENLSESTMCFAKSTQNLAESNKSLVESNKNLAAHLSKAVFSKSRR